MGRVFHGIMILSAALSPAATREGEKNALSKIKVASNYEAITDGQHRDIKAIADLLAETRTQYVHRAFYRYSSDLELESPTRKRPVDVYSVLKAHIAVLRKKTPGILIGGAIPAPQMSMVEHDPITDEIIPRDRVWQMALDPQKFGLGASKEEVHKRATKAAGIELHVPDLTNADFQKLFLNIVRKQIDSGVDAIWIDGLFVQANLCAYLAKEVKHASVKAAFEAVEKIVDAIHAYGDSKGKRVYVGSWGLTDWRQPGLEFPHRLPKLDFLTHSISTDEIRDRKIHEQEWKKALDRMRKGYGDVPVIAVIDWGFDAVSPLGAFSQVLSKDEARAALRNCDGWLREKGIPLAYPLHGGWMGWEAKRGAFGKTRIYDSLAPEFETWDTIGELAKMR